MLLIETNELPNPINDPKPNQTKIEPQLSPQTHSMCKTNCFEKPFFNPIALPKSHPNSSDVHAQLFSLRSGQGKGN